MGELKKKGGVCKVVKLAGTVFQKGKDRIIARYSRMRNLQKRVSGNIIDPNNLIKELFCVCIHNYSSL